MIVVFFFYSIFKKLMPNLSFLERWKIICILKLFNGLTTFFQNIVMTDILKKKLSNNRMSLEHYFSTERKGKLEIWQEFYKKSSMYKKNAYVLYLFFSTTSAKLLTSNLQVGTVIFKEKYLIKHDWYLRVLCH